MLRFSTFPMENKKIVVKASKAKNNQGGQNFRRR